VGLCPSAIATLFVSLFTTSCSSPLNPVEPGRPELAAVTAVALTDLGTLGGSHSEALAINARGQVAGFSTTATGERHAFFWDGGAMRDLGVFAGGTFGTPFIALNDAGQVAFTSVVASGERHAVLWDGTTVHDLGTLGGGTSVGTIINERGQVAGVSSLASGTSHAFFWDGAAMQDLGAVGGDDWPGDPSSWFSGATAINARGRVAGFSAGVLPAQELAFFWDGTTMRSLGTLGGADSHAMAMNDRGQVVGQSALPSST